MKLKTWILVELAAVAVIALAILIHPATDQSWTDYLLSLAKRLNPLR